MHSALPLSRSSSSLRRLALPLALTIILGGGAVPSATAQPDAGLSTPEVVERTDEHVRTRVALAASGDTPVDLPDADAHVHGSEPGEAEAHSVEPDAPTQEAVLHLEAGVSVLGVHWQGADHVVPALRVREAGGTWSDWQEMPSLEVEGENAAATEGNVVVGPAEVEVQVAGDAGAAVLEAWTTSPTAADAEAVSALSTGADGLVVGTRRDWGADESVRGTNPSRLIADTPKLGVTVHHTDGTNTYTADQVPAVIRGIYHYHAQTLDWGDIGYGLLVDRFGRAWEGRAGGVEENIQLAHSYGMNRDWQGISLLGSHEGTPVTDAAMRTLASLTAFTLDTHGVDAHDEVAYTNSYVGWSRTVDVVHGHSDAGSTLCPGYLLYTRLPELRKMTAAIQDRGGVTALQRIGGNDRYVVASRLAQEAFLEGTSTAYIASGESLPDALGVAPVAEAVGAAVLLTRRDALPQATTHALGALGVREVVLVGGELAIAPAVADELKARGLTVRRVSGDNRFSTAARLAEQKIVPGGTVYLASGVELADALGGAAAAAAVDGNLLLTRQGSLPAATVSVLRSLAPSRVVVLGGELAVGPAVVTEVGKLLPKAKIDRLGGADRYRTSTLVALDAFDSSSSVVVAAGTAAADALAGTQLAARHDAPVVLARPTCLPGAVSKAYDTLGVTLARLVGGEGVLAWEAGYRTC